MGRNKVQFQKGMSFAEFCRHYGSEEQCHAALIAMRWPAGFVCPKCGGKKHSYTPVRRIFQCSACRKQTSASACVAGRCSVAKYSAVVVPFARSAATSES